MKVAVLPTGRTEWHGLGVALARLFPGHPFECLPTAAEVASNPERFPYDGFTSATLTEDNERDPPEAAVELVERAAQEALGDRRREAADLVLIIDDVELQNARQTERVVSVMRRAVEQHLAAIERPSIQRRTRETLRNRVSFHLVKPMIEAWFFADPGALVAAGAPGTATLEGRDLEDFLTADPTYLADTEAACPRWIARGRSRKFRPKWLGDLPRERHPKGYLQWLCRDGAEKTCTTYDETGRGAPALAGLDWARLAGRPDGEMRFFRSFVADLADALSQDPATGPVTGAEAPETSRSRLPQDPLLRNM